MIGDQEEFNIFEALQRIENIVRIGAVHEVNPSTAKVRVESGDNITDWLPWAAMMAGVDVDWSVPSVGEQVVIFSPSGDMAQGIVFRGFYQDVYPQPGNDENVRKIKYSDGTEITLNKESKNLEIVVSAQVGDLTVTAETATIIANKIELGGPGGKGVARIGDKVYVDQGSSAGLYEIIEGSSVVKSL